jgi:hypothetical protein
MSVNNIVAKEKLVELFQNYDEKSISIEEVCDQLKYILIDLRQSNAKSGIEKDTFNNFLISLEINIPKYESADRKKKLKISLTREEETAETDLRTIIEDIRDTMKVHPSDYSKRQTLITAKPEKTGDNEVEKELLLMQKSTNKPSTESLINKPVYDIKDIFDRDAIISLLAAESLPIEGDIDWNDIIQQLQGLNPVTILSARTFLSRAPKQTAPLMVLQIKQANKDSYTANDVPACFHPNHKQYCEGELAKLALESDELGVARLAIESLGFLAASDWRSALFERLKSRTDYYADEIDRSVVITIARMFQLASFNTKLHSNFQNQLKPLLVTLENVIRHVVEKGWKVNTLVELENVISMCPSDRADLFLNHWLKSDHPDLRVLSATALGNMRLARTAIHLGERVKDRNEDVNVRLAATIALGNIGGHVAVRILREALQDEVLNNYAKQGLARCLDTVNQTDEFEVIADELLAWDNWNKCWVYRAIGVTRNQHFLNKLYESINDPDHIIRGQSALALARISGSNEYKRLEQCYSEATDPMEKILTSLALLIASNYNPSEIQLDELQQNLKIDSYRYDHLITDDILRELKQCKLERAQLLAQCWERIYKNAA